MEGVSLASAEIADSEKSYVDDLAILCTVFAAPLRAWGESAVGREPSLLDGSTTAEEVVAAVERLFQPLEAVLAFGRTFVTELRLAEQHGAWRAAFEKHEARLTEVYRINLAAYSVAWPEFSLLRKECKALEAFVRCCELQPANTRRLTLESLAIMPLQRTMRYPMLLGELRKRCGKVGGSFSQLGWTDDLSALETCELVTRRAATNVQAAIGDEEARYANLRRVWEKFGPSKSKNDWVAATAESAILLDAAMSRITKSGLTDSYLVLSRNVLSYGNWNSHWARRRDSPADEDAGKYSFSKSLNLDDVFVAQGSDARGGVAVSPNGLRPWEFLVIAAEKSFVISAADADVACEWVAEIVRASEAGACERRLSRRAPHVATAYMERRGKVTVEAFELSRLRQSEDSSILEKSSVLVAWPRSGAAPAQRPQSGVSMPRHISHVGHDDVRRSSLDAPPRMTRRTASVASDDTGRDGDLSRIGRDDDLSLHSPPPPPPPNPFASFGRNSSAEEEEEDSGLLVVTVPNDSRLGLGLELENVDGTVRVHKIDSPSLAADAGVCAGDVMLRVGDDEVRTTQDVVNAIKLRSSQQVVAIALRRRHESPPPPLLEYARDPPPEYAQDVVPPACSKVPADVAREIARTVATFGYADADAHAAIAAGVTDANAAINWILDNQPNPFR